jgi:hypothetical protein
LLVGKVWSRLVKLNIYEGAITWAEKIITI